MIDFTKILKEYGTPSYVYDIDTLYQRVDYLKSKLGNRYDLVYAVKANSFIAKHLENKVARFEICSPGEFDICDQLGISHQKMVISGVYKDQETIERIMMNDDILKYTVESFRQYQLLESLARKHHHPIHVLIRLTSGNQFGVSEEDLEEILTIYDKDWILIDGIEYFSGTQKHSLSRIQKEITYLTEYMATLEKRYAIEIEELEYGPGFPVFYYQGDSFDEEEFLEEVKKILDTVENHKVTLELGRSIAATCGYYLTSVVDMKTNQYGNYVILDGGIHHLVYYGQTMAMKVPHYELLPERDSESFDYHLCGSLCTINDFLVKNITTRKLEIGDTFVFKNVGAYSSTEGISLFLSRDLPKVLLCDGDRILLVRDTIKTSAINFPNNVEVEE